MPTPNDLVLVQSGGHAASFKPSQFIAIHQSAIEICTVLLTNGAIVVPVEMGDVPAFIEETYNQVDAYYTALNA